MTTHIFLPYVNANTAVAPGVMVIQEVQGGLAAIASALFEKVLRQFEADLDLSPIQKIMTA